MTKTRIVRRLCCGTALAVVLGAGFAGAAAAADPIKLGVGGSYTQYFGYVANDDTGTSDYTGFDQKADGEIVFSGETALDNGISFGVEVTLTAQTDTDQIDGSYLYSEGQFGRFELGSNDNVAVQMHFAAPDVGFGINDSDISDWVFNPSGGDADSAFSSTFLYLGENVADKVSWLSPRFSGLQLGLSYIPEFERNNNAQPAEDLYNNGYAISANYVKEFGGDVTLSLSAGYLAADKPKGASTKGAEGYSFGAQLAYDALTVGGSFAKTDGSGGAGTDSSISLDGSGFDIGVSYAFEPVTLSLSYYHGEVADSTATAGDSENDTVMLSASYEMGPGVSLIGSLFHTKFDADSGSKNEGTAILAGISLEF